MAEPRDPSLTQTLQGVLEAFQGSLWTVLPGVARQYSAASRTCTVDIGVKARLLDGTVVARPPIPNCRIVYPELGVWELTAPLADGTEGLILVSARSLETWRINGGIVDPNDRRMHDLSDAWFLPGGSSKPQTSAGQSADLVLRHASGDTEIRLSTTGDKVTVTGATVVVDASAVKLGGAAASLGVARETDPVSVTLTPADIATLAAALLLTTAFVPSGAPPVPPAAGVSVSGTITAGSSVTDSL